MHHGISYLQSTRRPLFQRLESRLCLSAVAFASHDIECCSADGARFLSTADVDGDGDIDVLSASYELPFFSRIVWYENTDGRGSFGPQQVISTRTRTPNSVIAADVDGDGDTDVLSAFSGGIAWYENTDGRGSFGSQQVITTQDVGVSSVTTADQDGDGDIDILSWRDDRIVWYENTDGWGSFGPQQVISNHADAARSVTTADLDGDGDTDVVSASYRDNKIAWYENTNGRGSFGSQQVISTEANGAWSVTTADVDGDGDTDVLSASSGDDKIAWYENTDGRGSFGPACVEITCCGVVALGTDSRD